ncbi:MAG: hypothetical protein V1823_04170 [Chloroflexota bacterium]
MDYDELSKLRQFYHSIIGQQRIFDSIPSPLVAQKSLIPLEHELNQLNDEFPSIVAAFNKNVYFSHSSGGDVYYGLIGIRAHIAMVLGRLQIVIEQPSDTPITESRQFAFISDTNIRKIIERDYDEIQRAYISKCWKSVIILCGGAIEATLTDLLVCHETASKQANSAPQKPDISRWDLSELINVAVELQLVTSGVEKLSHSMREYRNLVHPGNEIRNKLHFDAEEARISLEVLNILHRDLSE